MSDTMEKLVHAFERFPGVGPRQAQRFVYHLLATSASHRATLAHLINDLARDVHQCPTCFRFWSGKGAHCFSCADRTRDTALLMVVEKDQDLEAIEKTQTYRGHYFVLGGVLTLAGKGAIREQELLRSVDTRRKEGLKEIILALSATSEGEHTADRLREVLKPYRDHIRITTLGRGLSTGTELEYSDAETLSAALINRKES